MKKKKNKKKRHYALLISLALSTLLITVWSYFQLPRAYAAYVYDPLEAPVLAVAMQGIHDGVWPVSVVLPWEKTEGAENAPADDIVVEAEVSTPADDVVTDDAVTDGTAVTAGTATADTVVENEASDNLVTEGNVTEESTADSIEASAEPDSALNAESTGDASAEETSDDTRLIYHGPVDDDYFNDALFIGDSRMVGLSEYCEALDTRADFYVKKALTIYNLLDGKPIRSFDGTQKSLWDVLSEKQYGKIYIMVGINEIGVGNSEYFKEAYGQVIDGIRAAQPDAIIFINSIMHVSKSKSDSDSLYNNTNINARNDAIATLADNVHIFYLNINDAVDDENGALRSDITFDDIHLKGSCYEPWHQYLLTHGIK